MTILKHIGIGLFVALAFVAGMVAMVGLAVFYVILLTFGLLYRVVDCIARR